LKKENTIHIKLSNRDTGQTQGQGIGKTGELKFGVQLQKRGFVHVGADFKGKKWKANIRRSLRKKK